MREDGTSFEGRQRERVAVGDRQALRANTEAAIAAGVFGVPTLEVAGALFWGLDALPMARAVMADPGLLDRGEMGRIGGLGGVQRRRA